MVLVPHGTKEIMFKCSKIRSKTLKVSKRGFPFWDIWILNTLNTCIKLVGTLT